MSLRVLLADADGTLFDFHRGEAVAIGETFRRFGIPDTPGNLEIYSRVNHAQWLRLERGETTQERLRVDRFTDFLRETGLEGDAQALCDCYVELLGRQRYILSGAKEFCRAVSARMPIYLITNGISQIQRSRFGDCAITPYLSGMVISEEVGHAKPHPAMRFTRYKFRDLDPAHFAAQKRHQHIEHRLSECAAVFHISPPSTRLLISRHDISLWPL